MEMNQFVYPIRKNVSGKFDSYLSQKIAYSVLIPSEEASPVASLNNAFIIASF